MIAVCMVTKNNEKTIKNCLNSLVKINCRIYYTDMGSSDKTKEYLKNFKEISSVEGSFKENKNNLIKQVDEKCLFFINPWEEFLSGEDIINNLENSEGSVYKVLILNKEIINKSIRIINKPKIIEFENQIYEEIYNKNAKTVNIFLKQNEHTLENEEKLIVNWIKKEKINSVPYYYASCIKLKNKNYKDFIIYAEKYLFLEKNKKLPSILMTKYYLSLIHLHILKDMKKAATYIVQCIDEKPDMAEFWCVLGDMNFYLKKYQKAIYFYKNAIIFGKLRSEEDDLSIDIKKYKIYPEKMIDNCKQKINEEIQDHLKQQ